ncbi:MAG: ParB N-terminal domain-containing protein [Desulfarculus sp.]|nr:ParB N-terminal domain-containing protein [Desulfarculus sp.]
MSEMIIEHVAIAALTPYGQNPRKYGPAEVEKFAAALREFGFRVPVLALRDGRLIDGHFRLAAARAAGLHEVPALYVDGWPEEKVKAFRLAVSRMAELASWDEDKLAQELRELTAQEFDLGLIGFDSSELERLLAQGASENAGAGDAPKVNKGLAGMDDLAPDPQELAILAGRRVLVEFSGGKDSTAAALWVRRFLPDNPVELCFVDMGADFIGFHGHLATVALALAAPLKTLRSREHMIEVFLQKAKLPHFGHPYCHEVLHKTLDAYMKEHAPESVAIVRGGRLQERGKKGKTRPSRFMTVDRLKGYAFFQPLYFATKDAADDILRANGVPIWAGYARGLQRIACRICPGQKPKAYAAMRQNFPEVFEELLWLEAKLGTGYWQDKTTDKSASIEHMADRGQKAFEEGLAL